MVLHDCELNLSLKEFQYFQECPQKFRLYRILNPLPDKETFLKKKRPIQEYELRNYSEDEMKGIKYHQFFSLFHLNYEYSIKKNSLPIEFLQEPVCSKFWKYQLQRYRTSLGKYPWKPLLTEFNIMTQKQRGIIDSIEFNYSDEELIIIDYKKAKHEKDLESLYFYVILLEDFLKEEAWDNLSIKEIGCYYYQEGELCKFEINKVKKRDLLTKINNVQNSIRDEKLSFIKGDCATCSLKIICEIECKRN